MDYRIRDNDRELRDDARYSGEASGPRDQGPYQGRGRDRGRGRGDHGRGRVDRGHGRREQEQPVLQQDRVEHRHYGPQSGDDGVESAGRGRAKHGSQRDWFRTLMNANDTMTVLRIFKENRHRFTPFQLANAAHRAGKWLPAYMRGNIRDNMMREHFEALASVAQRRVAEFDDVQLALVAWGFGTARVEVPDLFKAIGTQLSPHRLERYGSKQLAMLANGLVNANVNAPEVLGAAAAHWRAV